jgi:hypothetical protein
MIHPKVPPLSPPLGVGRGSCNFCGSFYHEVELKFDSGSVAPTVGETITGATSTDTGVVDDVELLSGSYAGGDAAGILTLSSPTGCGADITTTTKHDYGLWGTDNEALNGSTGGADMMTLNGNGHRKSYGRLWPENQLIFRDGKYWCPEHYKFRYSKQDRLDATFDITDRGGIT